ncbi:hypothetical protein Tco_0321259 [Tanacetum coccineum]
MHTSRDDYLINTLRFVSTKKESQIYGARLPKSMTSPSPKEPTRKSKRVKRSAKKSSNAPTACVVIRETHLKSLSKKKEKITIEKCKGIDLHSEVALTEEAQYEEVRKKILRDFHKTHSSGSGSDQERDSGDDNTQSDSENGSDFEHETDENESGSESDQEENEEEIEDDEEEEKDEFIKTSSNDTDDEDETKIKDKVEVDTDKGFIQKQGTDAEMINVQQGNENPKISQVIEDAHVTLFTVPQKTEVPVTSSSHSSNLASKFLNFLDIPHTDAEIVSPMDVLVHHEVPSNQTPTLFTVPVSVITESSPIYTTVIPQSLPSFAPPPPQSTPTPPPTTEATNPPSELPNFAAVFQFNNRVTSLEKEVAELKKNDPLNTQVTALVDEHLDSRLGATKDEFMSYLSKSITARIVEQVMNQLP